MAARVETIAGTGTAGCSETQVNNPYGMAIGPDGGLYFCEVSGISGYAGWIQRPA